MKLSEATRKAIQLGVTKAENVFVEEDAPLCMCLTSAIYYACTGIIPKHWNTICDDNYNVGLDVIQDEIKRKTGLDLEEKIVLPGNHRRQDILRTLLDLNDLSYYRDNTFRPLTFTEIADILESIGR